MYKKKKLILLHSQRAHPIRIENKQLYLLNIFYRINPRGWDTLMVAVNHLQNKTALTVLQHYLRKDWWTFIFIHLAFIIQFIVYLRYSSNSSAINVNISVKTWILRECILFPIYCIICIDIRKEVYKFSIKKEKISCVMNVTIKDAHFWETPYFVWNL